MSNEPDTRSDLPILDEVGRSLNREFVRRERDRRRRVVAVALTTIGIGVAVSFALRASDRDSQRAPTVSVASIGAGDTTVKLVAARNDSGICLEPRNGGDGTGTCVGTRGDNGIRTAVYKPGDGTSVVYGVVRNEVKVVRLVIDGRPRDVSTARLPEAAQTLSDVPDGLRYFLVSLGAESDGAEVERQGPNGDGDIILRVPQSRRSP